MKRLYESAKARNQKQSRVSPTSEWVDELKTASNTKPEPEQSPKFYVDPDLPAHHRLAALEEHYVAQYGHKEEMCNPLKLVPNMPCKDDGNLKEMLYVLNHQTLCRKPLAWAMREDAKAVKEIFDLVKPYALWIFAPNLSYPNWAAPIPEVARQKIVKLCVIEAEICQLKDLRGLLRRTRDLENLQSIEFFRKPRLVSESGRKTRKFTHACAVEYGMKPEVRLFFRWAFAEDEDVHGNDRKQRVKHVTEFVRESAPDGNDPPPVIKEAAHEYPQFSLETFAQGAICSPHVLYEGYNPYLG
jgi:hypothetical protein